MSTDFYSMDKLVEFGMSMAIANQMASSMNRFLNQMQVPGAGQAIPVQNEIVYYAVLDGKQAGPYSLTEVARLIAEKRLSRKPMYGKLAWKSGI